MSKMKKFDKLIVLDLESTCFSSPQDNSNNEPNEIIEVGVATINLSTLEIEENEGIIVKPQKSRISKYCEELTSITQEMVDTQGISLFEAMNILKDKYKIHKRTMASFGDYDRRMLISDCLDKGFEYPGISRSHINIKNILTVELGWEKEIGLDRALNRFNLSFEEEELHHHRGFADAFLTAKMYVKHLKKVRS